MAGAFFWVFLCCAILPISALTLLSYQQVARHLKEQSHLRLRHVSKNVGMAVYEHLSALNNELQMLGALSTRHPDQFSALFPLQQDSKGGYQTCLGAAADEGKTRQRFDSDLGSADLEALQTIEEFLVTDSFEFVLNSFCH